MGFSLFSDTPKFNIHFVATILSGELVISISYPTIPHSYVQYPFWDARHGTAKCCARHHPIHDARRRQHQGSHGQWIAYFPREATGFYPRVPPKKIKKMRKYYTKSMGLTGKTQFLWVQNGTRWGSRMVYHWKLSRPYQSWALRPELNYSLSWITGTKGPERQIGWGREREREKIKCGNQFANQFLSDSHFSVGPGGLFFSPFLDTGVAALRQWLKDALPAPGQSTNRWAHETAKSIHILVVLNDIVTYIILKPKKLLGISKHQKRELACWHSCFPCSAMFSLQDVAPAESLSLWMILKGRNQKRTTV